MADAEEKLNTLNVESQRGDWVHENFITDDTEALSAKGDQRLIDEWVGHTTEEMRRRYRHLIPSLEQQAIRSVFVG